MRFEEWVLRRRAVILATVAVVSLLGAASYSRLEIANNIDAWFAPEAFADELRAVGFVNVGFRRLSLGAVALHWGERPAA